MHYSYKSENMSFPVCLALSLKTILATLKPQAVLSFIIVLLSHM